MKKMATALAAAMMLALMAVLPACSGTVQERQESADQVFGTAKMSLVVATGLVSVYNLMPVCSDQSLPPPLCYSEAVGDILNKGLAGAAAAIESSEAIFAAANTDEAARLKAANVAQAIIAELLRNLTKFGLTQIKSGAG
ncbi:hypothetical protein [Reyranella sp.]|jgi:hypothetical protein|uniref:hypothetical protein n=1 Tax=Reyranella sp. TaxID=1929291 RepID=UPI000BD68168|nr:hypothetical protein [Reyranella sp.]OYY44019.1 MAG: hypothetical protein B7Y57_07495 [Rhodospirillales bacterium 35-66-84]OYZ94695.1 MAG: hypothetical protein B7Y08_10375 [Rhodospirillales bacterium 24-66-33]OZB26231.1 MAG: hypothetical protein B7X63_09835 [Rhodospirillales bacterium 39-66-50]HQS15049.1 hypothetical protein [Reyranella sp.]HQT10858.1 hypothetical protein [Reyranella sp.]